MRSKKIWATGVTLLAIVVLIVGIYLRQPAAFLTKAQIDEDVNYLIEQLEEYYIYKDLLTLREQQSFENLCQWVQDDKQKYRSERDFAVTLNAFIGSLQNPHTKLDAGEFGEEGYGLVTKSQLTSVQDYLRLTDYWSEILDSCQYQATQVSHYIEGSYVVPSNDGVHQIEAINGQSVDEFVASNWKLYPCLKRDKVYNKFYTINLFEISSTKPVTLEVKYTNGFSEKIAVDKPYKYQPASADSKTYIIDNKRIVYAYVPVMHNLNNASSAIYEAKTADALIIDVRGNGGGFTAEVESLLTRINSSVSVSEGGYYFAKPEHVNTNGRIAVREINTDRSSAGIMTFVRTKSIAYDPSWTDTPVYILADSRNYSATEVFLQVVKTGELATIVGDYSGGSMGCVGAPLGRVIVSLPNSGIGVIVEYVAYVDADGKLSDEWGTTPDVWSRQSLKDFEAFVQSDESELLTSTYDTAFQECMRLIMSGE